MAQRDSPVNMVCVDGGIEVVAGKLLALFMVSIRLTIFNSAWTDSPIHTSKVDEGILLAVLMYSDRGDSSTVRLHCSALQPPDQMKIYQINAF